MTAMKRLVASLFALLLVTTIVAPAPAAAGCAPWCKPRCHLLCKEYVCYKVTGTFHSESGVTTFTIANIIDDAGVEVPYLRGMTFLVSADSEVGIETETFKAHFTYDETKATQIVLHQPPAQVAAQ